MTAQAGGSEMHDPFFGRGQENWEKMRDKTEELLIRVAKGNSETTYTGVKDWLHTHKIPSFDFKKNPHVDPHAIGSMLGEISEKSYRENGIILSSICRKEGGATVGGGFWTLLENLKLVSKRLTEKEKAVVLHLLSRQTKDFYLRRS